MCSSQQLTSTQVNSHILTWLRYSHSSIQRSIKLHTCTTTGWSTVVRAQLYTLLTHCRFRQVKVVSRITCLHSSWLYYNRIWASVLEQLPMADNIELWRVTKVIASNTVEDSSPQPTASTEREGQHLKGQCYLCLLKISGSNMRPLVYYTMLIKIFNQYSLDDNKKSTMRGKTFEIKDYFPFIVYVHHLD